MARSLFGSVIKTRSGNWRGRYRVNQNDYYTPTVRTKTEARQLLAEIHARIVRNEWTPPRNKAFPANLTFKEWSNKWIEAQEDQGRSPNTIRARRSQLRVHINPLVGNTRLIDLTQDHAQLIYETAKAKTSPASARNTLLCFSAALTAAKKARLIDTNTAQVEGGFTTHRPQRPKIALETDQLEDLIAATPGKYQLGILVMSYGALRYGETSGLMIPDIDPEALTVTVQRATKRGPDGGLVLGPPKSAAGYRTVALPTRHSAIVLRHLRLFAHEKTGLLFHDERTRSGLTSNRMWNHVIREAASAAKLPTQIGCHDLRHTGLTLYGRQGATIADLMCRAGHTKADAVMIYQHSNQMRDRELTERM